MSATGASGRTLDPREVEFVLAFADDEHLMGQRHTEWIGVAPFLEEDLAFASIGQDELGHAVGLYELVDDDVDQLGLFRTPDEYRSSWLVEQPCRDWAEALVRHLLYDEAEVLRWECVQDSRLRPLADLAARAEREETYHRRHAHALVDAIAGDPTATARIRTAVDTLLPLAVAQFEPVAGEDAALASGLAARPWASTIDRWRDAVSARLGPVDWDAVDVPDQRARTRRSDQFGAVYDSIREVVLLDPDASW